MTTQVKCAYGIYRSLQLYEQSGGNAEEDARSTARLPLPGAQNVNITLVATVFIELLRTIQTEKFSRYIYEGIQQEFRIDFNAAHSGNRNMMSAKQHPEVVDHFWVKI